MLRNKTDEKKNEKSIKEMVLNRRRNRISFERFFIGSKKGDHL